MNNQIPSMKTFESPLQAATVVRVSLRAVSVIIASGVLLFSPANSYAGVKDVNVEQPVEVQIVNEAPVPVESVDDALREPYVKKGFVYVPAGDYGAEVSVAIPAGKRLVVETVSFDASVREGQGAVVSMRRHSDSSFDGTPLSPQFAMPWQVSVGSFTRYTGTHAMRLRVDAPSDSDGALDFTISRNSNVGDLSSLSVVVMGYLVDL
jgi:hypothetical protein